MNKSDAAVGIDTKNGCLRYDRMIFGQFIEHFHRVVYGGIFDPGSPLSDKLGLRKDVIAALRELHVPVVRWPGGCFVSAYHWKDGIGKDRQPSFDKAWYVEEPNTFGTDEFVAWCRAIGAEPYICTNAGTGTSEEMSDWVEYCNGRLGKWARARTANGNSVPHDVKYWSIGNENWGSHEIGAKKAGEWAAFVTESAKMMLRVDPSIKLLAAALPDPNWTLPLLREAGQYLSYVSIHDYWDPRGQYKHRASGYEDCMMFTVRPEQSILATKKILTDAGFAGKVNIAFDEWNLRAWHHPDLGGTLFGDVKGRDDNDINSTYTMADAVFTACFLNTCMRHADTVRMACMAPAVNVRGSLFVHPGGIVKRTTYHVLSMYANLLSANVVPVTIESAMFGVGKDAVPAVDAVATCDDGMKRWRIVLVNRHPEHTVRCRLAIPGAALDGKYKATVLSGDGPDSCNDVQNPQRVVPVEAEIQLAGGAVDLPPHSISIVIID